MARRLSGSGADLPLLPQKNDFQRSSAQEVLGVDIFERSRLFLA